AEPLDLDADAFVIPMDRRFGGPGRGGRGFRGQGGPPGGPPPPGPPPPRGSGRPDGRGPQEQPRDPEDERWIVAELNHDVLITQILPALVVRRFPNYENQDY